MANLDMDQTKSGCKHYQRMCKFVSPCCSKLFSCRLCHDEEISSHKLNRHAVEKIVCCACTVTQGISNKCISCHVKFGNYFCAICRLYDDKDKGQFHCELCGICRVGGRINFKHCETCGFCLPNSIIESHKCIESNSKRNCPICLEDIHNSTIASHVPSCGHVLHTSCYESLLKAGDYRCAICGVSVVSMKEQWKMLDTEIEHTPMPEEYSNIKQWILCKDCHKVSEVKFHILGLKCQPCGSYNTCGTDAPSTEV
uniref:RING finger and CHY zinc finger domain-containing protein 1 n=1 Tax=Phallusia mammillata TaxID=59560 RepID=A0A6F9DR75_9ASCI|nr:RING finger and CHY zinc finger domain-containing protein 1 [Phallusia mammillata]